MGDAAVEVQNVTKHFGATTAARAVDLRVDKGEFFSFVGPSGCGKTTVLRMIAGFETPTSGKILIDGKDIVNIPPHKRPVNMVFQNYALFPHLTVLENIGFGLRFASGVPKSEWGERSKQALALVRLEHLADRYPSQLSGGQQQRIALARAIVKEPLVLLLDEPLSALDPHIREEMQLELARLQQELGMTFIMVTHDQDEALALSHRVAVFCAGNLEQVGAPDQIYSEPRTKFVAQFMGQSNLLPCVYLRYTSNRHEVQLEDGTTFGASGSSEERLEQGERCFVCVKPESIKMTSADDGVLRGKVRSSNYKGSATEYFVEIGKQNVRMELAHLSRSQMLAPGAEVGITIESDAAWIIRDHEAKSAESRNLTVTAKLT